MNNVFTKPKKTRQSACRANNHSYRIQYNVLARSEYNLPVLTCVFYLRRDGKVKQPPLTWMVPLNNWSILTFNYLVIEVSKLTPDDIRRLGSTALLPLLPLTAGGATRKVVGEMLDTLIDQGKDELSQVGFLLSWLIFQQDSPKDSDWLRVRYKNMFEILYEEPLYQTIFQEGKAEGKIEALQHAAIRGIQTKFPQFEQLAQHQMTFCKDEKQLDDLIVQIYIAQDERIVKQMLLALSITESH